MSFKHPFQKICYISNSHGQFLLCASGSNIYSAELQKGSISASWPVSDIVDPETLLEGNGQKGEGEPPAKKQKTDPEGQDVSRESSISVDLVTEKQERIKGQRRKPKLAVPSPNVSHVIATNDGEYVVAVTAEDKCVRVFQVLKHGVLESRSER